MKHFYRLLYFLNSSRHRNGRGLVKSNAYTFGFQYWFIRTRCQACRRLHDIPYMPVHLYIAPRLPNRVYTRCRYTVGTYIYIYMYIWKRIRIPLEITCRQRRRFPTAERWAARESGIKCNFDTRNSLLLSKSYYSQGARILSIEQSRLATFFIAIWKRERRSYFIRVSKITYLQYENFCID